MRSFSTESFPHLAICLLDLFRGWVATGITLLMAFFWRVSIGRGCRCYGLPIIRRLPGSRISVGNYCTFRSAAWSNLAGLNHPCILATLGKDAFISIGDDCGFSGAAIGAAQAVTIGNRVMVGANASISDTDWHPVDSGSRAAGEAGASMPVTIEDDVWLGANVMVLKGVSIGAGTVVAANSVVTKSIPAGVLAAGVPACVVRNLKES